MKKYISLGIIVILCFSLIINVHLNSSKSKGKSKSSKKNISIPITFKINQDSFIAASLLKALGVNYSMDYLLLKIQKNCKKLKVLKQIKNTIKIIKELTEKSVERGFDIAKSQIRNIFGKKMKRSNFRSLGISYRQGIKIFGGGVYSDINISNHYDHFRSKGGKKKKPAKSIGKKRKMSKLEKQCRSKGFYNVAMGILNKTRERIRKLKRRKLINVIKRTFRRILARMLGCHYVRFSKFSKIIRSAQSKLTNEGIGSNVEKLAIMLKRINSNYKPKKKKAKKPAKKQAKKSKKIVKKIFSKLITGKKISKKMKSILKKLTKNNCRAASKCFRNNIYTKKCFTVSRLCLSVKSIVKKIKAKKVGTAVSKILKQIFKEK
jgi:hypothetical protein